MQHQASVEIDRPIEKVFRLTTEHVAEWSTVVLADDVLEEQPGGVGTTFHTVTEDHGCRMEFDGVVTRHEPPHAHVVHLTGRRFDIDAEYTFEDLAGRTRVTHVSRVTGKGFSRVFLELFGRLMHKSSCKALQKELDGLKRFCEAQPAPTASAH